MACEGADIDHRRGVDIDNISLDLSGWSLRGAIVTAPVLRCRQPRSTACASLRRPLSSDVQWTGLGPNADNGRVTEDGTFAGGRAARRAYASSA
jgi:hypothetical protein